MASPAHTLSGQRMRCPVIPDLPLATYHKTQTLHATTPQHSTCRSRSSSCHARFPTKTERHPGGRTRTSPWRAATSDSLSASCSQPQLSVFSLLRTISLLPDHTFTLRLSMDTLCPLHQTPSTGYQELCAPRPAEEIVFT